VVPATADKGVLMYGRVVIYSYDEDKDDLEARARAGVIPLVTNTPGYIAYGVLFQDDRVISFSAWESEEHAKAGDAALIEWVKTNTTMKVESRFTGDLAWLELAARQAVAQ
jgi:heme-degrading monooxygenase HmoA